MPKPAQLQITLEQTSPREMMLLPRRVRGRKGSRLFALALSVFPVLPQ